MRLALPVLLLLASPIWGEPPKITIPPVVRPTGQYVQFVPETNAVSVHYVGLSGVSPFPSDFLSDKRAFVLDTYGKAAGKYDFTAVAAGSKGEQTAVAFSVLIGDVPPGPSPGPSPGPTPPSDPFTQALKTAWTLELAQDKQQKSKLVNYYKAAAAIAANPAHTTNAALWTALKSEQVRLDAAGVLPKIREVMREEAYKIWPQPGASPGAAPTPQERTAAAAMYAKAAQVLEGLQ